MESRIYEELFLLERNYWWHVSKRKLVFNIIKNLRIPVDSKILDVGCGTGVVMKELGVDFDNVYGIDTSDLALKYCQKRKLRKLELADLEKKLPFPDKNFHLVTCLDVIEHVENDEKALREIHRLLKPGGHVLITVPAFQFLWTVHDDLLWHKRRYRKSSLAKIVGDCGFKVKKASYFYSFLFPAAVLLFKIKIMFNNKKGETSVVPPRIINNILLLICSIERQLLSFLSLPFGLSIVLLAQKI